MKRPLNLCAALAAALCASGCDKDEPAVAAFPDGLNSIWGEMFAPYGLYPLFPVRTGVQPGDVFVMCRKAPPLEARVSAAASAPDRAASEPEAASEYEWRQLFDLPGIGQALAEQAATRMAYHALPHPSAASAPLGAASGAAPFSTGNAATNVGFASFPTVLAYTQRRADLGVGAGLSQAAVGAGASKSAQGTYLLEIPAAEFAALSHSQLQKVLKKAATELPEHVNQSLKKVAEAYADKTCIDGSLSVAGEVFYARRINVSVGDSYAGALSARAAYQLPTDSARAEVFKALGSYATGASAPAGPASSAFPSEGARFAKLMMDIDAAYKAADANSKLGFTGVQAGFAKAGGKGVSMDYSYAHPVAFGVRLYSLDLKEDGTLGDQLSLTGARPWGGHGAAVPLEGELKGKAPTNPHKPPPPASAANQPPR